MPPLNSLPPEAKLIQVTSTVTKHANKSFLSRLRGFFPYFSLWVEGWLWIGWVMGFGWFKCFLFFMVLELGINLEALFSPFFSHLLNQISNLYVDLVAFSSTRLKSSSIIFSLKAVFSR
jgi:hypothetical protein